MNVVLRYCLSQLEPQFSENGNNFPVCLSRRRMVKKKNGELGGTGEKAFGKKKWCLPGCH